MSARPALPCLVLLCLAHCWGGAPAGSGLGAALRVEGAQFYPGDLPAEDGGPAVLGLLIEQNQLRAGEVGRAVTGTLAQGATAVVLALSADSGSWIVRAGVPDVRAPELPTFLALASIAPGTPPGPRDLLARAAGPDRRLGPLLRQPLTILAEALPDGELVFTLSWDTRADLDLHVVTPAGEEIWARRPAGGGGVLDLDAGGGCFFDGQRRERVRWSASPRAGRYLALVDAVSLCGAPAANFTLAAHRRGALLAQAWGQRDETSTRGPHDRGAGLLVLAVDVP